MCFIHDNFIEGKKKKNKGIMKVRVIWSMICICTTMIADFSFHLFTSCHASDLLASSVLYTYIIFESNLIKFKPQSAIN